MSRSGSSMPPDGVSMERSASPPPALLYMQARKSCTAGITRDGFDSVSRSVESLFTWVKISLILTQVLVIDLVSVSNNFYLIKHFSDHELPRDDEAFDTGKE